MATCLGYVLAVKLLWAVGLEVGWGQGWIQCIAVDHVSFTWHSNITYLGKKISKFRKSCSDNILYAEATF